jgi:acyl carrier protein
MEDWMTEQDFINELENMMGIDHGALNKESGLKDNPQWDSMQILTFILTMEDKFKLIVEGNEVAKAKTVKDLMLLLGDTIQA